MKIYVQFVYEYMSTYRILLSIRNCAFCLCACILYEKIIFSCLVHSLLKYNSFREILQTVLKIGSERHIDNGKCPKKLFYDCNIEKKLYIYSVCVYVRMWIVNIGLTFPYPSSVPVVPFLIQSPEVH